MATCEATRTDDAALPNSVRYVKNGAESCWWPEAKSLGRIYAGWDIIADDLLRSPNWAAIESTINAHFGKKPGAKQDFNALRTLLDHPSQHLWVTFEDGALWWSTVSDEIGVQPGGSTKERGHLWLTCARPWSNYSLHNKRRLTETELPGTVAAVRGFRATVCQPRASMQILRIISNEADEDARVAEQARTAYEAAIATLITRLGWRDFELLIDLVLSRSGWLRVGTLGRTKKDVDIEAENVAADETAFVQIKSQASQSDLDECASAFMQQREQFARMIFAVHSPNGVLKAPLGHPINVWTVARIAHLVVKHGLGEWVAHRL
jgi:hypothetical protein